MRLAYLLLALLAGAALPAWAGTPVVETRFSEQCALASAEPALRLFNNANDWQAFKVQAPLPAFGRRTDWRRQDVLVFTIGTRPTPGYTLSLKTSRLRHSDRTLLLEVSEQTPAADAFLPQMLTQPCLAFMLRRSNWRQIQVRDADSGTILKTLQR